MTKWSQMFWVVAAARCTFNHHNVQFAFMANFIIVGISSIPRHLAPAAPWLRRFVISHTQHQTEAAFTAWTQLQRFFTNSKLSQVLNKLDQRFPTFLTKATFPRSIQQAAAHCSYTQYSLITVNFKLLLLLFWRLQCLFFQLI